jgi:hypothetical protein
MDIAEKSDFIVGFLPMLGANQLPHLALSSVVKPRSVFIGMDRITGTWKCLTNPVKESLRHSPFLKFEIGRHNDDYKRSGAVAEK